MADFTIKAFDRLPSIQAALTQKDINGIDQPIDLSTAVSIKFIMKNKATGTVKVNSTSVVVVGSASLGIVRYDWGATDTSTIGEYQAEWEITWPSSKKQTVPTGTYHSVDVVADLDGA